jgi:hypothetical protein
MCLGSWNRLPHMTSTNSGVSNIYSQTSEATSYLSSISPTDLEQLEIDTQEMEKHSKQEMIHKDKQEMSNSLHLSLAMDNSKGNSVTYAQAGCWSKRSACSAVPMSVAAEQLGCVICTFIS